SLAFDRSYQKNGEWQQETSYIDVIVWSKRGEQCAENLHKGSPVIVEGYLKTRSYTDSNNQNRKIAEVVAGKISFLEKSDYVASPESTGNDFTRSSQPEPSSEITDDDVPF
ncbi:MAG: single-stranded DNA-binding protein, partial [Candidatus Heimdallarchaeota archaeon]|nr:single-stranded DNA-binding protein [Candidatus Heimdallarchaeota archaeon]